MRRKPSRPPVALAISGSDPSGGAGLERDLQTFAEHGIRGMALATLLTAQNRREVRAVRFLDPDFLKLQWQTLFAESRPDVIKIGALGSHAMVRRVGQLLRSPEARGIPVVLDPVFLSTSGKPLLDPSALGDLIHLVFPLCRIVTPNAPELSCLGGTPVNSENAEVELRRFSRGKPYAVLLKGGHLEGVESVDFLYDRGKVTRLRAVRWRTPGELHGSGCMLASALAANLALGRELAPACRKAKAFVLRALKARRE